jgi:UDP-3-O-[3-hydroxymyristoyl] glucosamine N-acyltransferase
MVVIKQYSNTQIASLNSLTGRVLYDSTLNVLRFNDSASYNNILLFKDTSNNVTGLNDVRTTGNFGINTSSADKQAEINSATGDCLRLTYNDNNGSATNYSDFLVSSTGDLTITPSGGDITLNSSVLVNNNLSITGPTLKIPVGNTAARPASPEVGYIRYNSETSQFEGFGAGSSWGSLGGVSDVDQNTKILAEDGAGTNDNNLRFFNDGNESMRLTAGSLMGLGTTAPDKKLEINSATGDCLRLTYNDNNGSAANYVDLLVSSGGDFNITPSGNDTTFNSTMSITGATTLSSTLGVTGATTLSNTTDATSSTVGGALSIAGGAGIAKKLFVGTDLAVGGNSSLTGTLGVTGATTLSSTLGVTGATTLSSTLGVTGATTLSNTTDATSSTVGGSLTVAGGAAIAKKLYVGTDITGASMIFSSSETGNLDANAFDTITQYSRTVTPSFIYDSYYNLAFNSNRSYWTSDATNTGTVSAGSVLTNYQTAAGFNGSSVTNSNPLCTLNDGNLLFTTRFNTSSSQYAAGLLLGTKTALTSVLWSGNLQESGTASITSIAAKNINNIVFLTNDSKMIYTTNGSTFIENTNKPTGISYDTLTGSSLVWASGFNMFLIGLSSGSGIAYSSNGITWTNATTPSNANRSYIYYNPILNKAFAYNTGTNTLLVTSNGTNWTSSTLPSLTGTTFGQFLNNTHTGLVAIYPDPASSVKNLIYSVDGTTWNTKLITSTSSIPGKSWLFSKENIVVFSNNVAFWSLLNTSWQIALTSPLVSEANIFKLNYLSGYLANQSKTGYQWYSSSTNSSVGTKIMEIDNQLDVNVPQYITDATNSTSSSTGSLRIAGGVGIAKDVNIGQAINVTGVTTLSSTLSVTGAATFSSTLGVTGATTLSNTTDATSSAVGGSLTVAGGAGIAKKLFVGTDFAVGGNSSLTGSLGVTGATTLSSTLNITGATTLSNTTDATSSTVGGSLTVAGGAGIAKKLFVGTDFAAGGNSSLTGTLGVTGDTTLSSTLGVTGATTLSSTLGVTGATTLSSTLGVTGVVSLNNTTDATSSTVGGSLTLAGGAGIAKKLFVGTDFAVGGNSSLTGTLAVTGNSVLTGSLGVGTSAPDKKVEINSSTGDCLRLTYDDSDGTATNYADMLVSSTGNLTITPSGGDVNISSHNGSSTGLKLNNVLVTSTAAELNYNDTTVGIGAANKAVILDSNRNFVNLNYVEIDELAVIKTNSANNTIVYPLSLYAVPSTTAAIGLGTGIEFNSVNDTDQIYNAGYINYVSSNITTNSETGFLDFKVANSGSINSVATISNNGVLSVTSLVETSDVRSKENIQETLSSDSLEKILNVNVKTYNYIKDHEKRHHIGVIAQEIKEIIPESVIISKNDDFEDFHQVQYTSLVPHLINCIKVLNEEIKELKSKLNQ